ncbi:MAG: diacylglycerol kinase family protein [Anaerotruncus massiliensis (ex Togo et al. 2019)]
MDNRRMLFLINPHAGKAEIKGKALDLIDLFVRGGWEVTVHTTQRRLEIADLLPRRAGQYGLIVCSGGDGTLNETITGLMRCLPEGRPPVGYIPAGTVNDFASSLGISKNMHEAAATILSGEPFLCDVGAFGDRYFSYIAAFGAFTDVSYQTPAVEKPARPRRLFPRGHLRLPPSRPTACPSPTTARRSRANSSSAWSPTPPRSAASSSGRARTSR